MTIQETSNTFNKIFLAFDIKKWAGVENGRLLIFGDTSAPVLDLEANSDLYSFRNTLLFFVNKEIESLKLHIKECTDNLEEKNESVKELQNMTAFLKMPQKPAFI